MKLTDPVERLAVLAHRKGGWGKLAAEFGVSASFISSIRCGRKSIPDYMLQKIGLRRVVTVTYEEIT